MLYQPNMFNPQASMTQSLPPYLPQVNYFQPQMMPNLPQYTNLDIPGTLDQSLKQMQETLQKLKVENASLKTELNKK